VVLPSGSVSADTQGGAIGNAIEPTGQGLSFANGAGLARQDQENSLEDIFDIGFLSK
jgi:hypothetical protein